MGDFIFYPEINKGKHIVLWGAGSGITPIMSIIKTVLNGEPESTFVLVYGNKTVEGRVAPLLTSATSKAAGSKGKNTSSDKDTINQN